MLLLRGALCPLRRPWCSGYASFSEGSPVPLAPVCTILPRGKANGLFTDARSDPVAEMKAAAVSFPYAQLPPDDGNGPVLTRHEDESPSSSLQTPALQRILDAREPALDDGCESTVEDGRESIISMPLTMDYEATFTTMAIRRFQRRWTGVRHSGGGAGAAFFVFSTLTVVTLVSSYYRTSFYSETGAQAGSQRIEQSVEQTEGLYLVVSYSTLVSCAIAAILYAIVASCRVEWLFRWLFYFYVLLLVARIAIFGHTMNGHIVLPTDTPSVIINVLDGVWGICLLSTILVWCAGLARTALTALELAMLASHCLIPATGRPSAPSYDS